MLTHDGYYRQKDGLSMGGKPAPPLANIWLAKFEPDIRDNAKLFERYMDDIIREIKVQEIQAKLEAINQLHPMLKFTMEREEDGKIPFLDMEIIHKDNHLSSTWYVKQTDTGLIMNYHALAPRRYKKSVVQSFVHRIYRCCSSWELVTSSLQRAKVVLEKKQYPRKSNLSLAKPSTRFRDQGAMNIFSSEPYHFSTGCTNHLHPLMQTNHQDRL